MGKFFEKKAFFALTPIKVAPGEENYSSVKGYGAEFGNRAISGLVNVPIGMLLGGALFSPLVLFTGNKDPILLGASIGGALTGSIGDYRTLRKSERETLGKEKTSEFGYLVRRLTSDAFSKIPPLAIFSDYLLSRKIL